MSETSSGPPWNSTMMSGLVVDFDTSCRGETGAGVGADEKGGPTRHAPWAAMQGSKTGCLPGSAASTN